MRVLFICHRIPYPPDKGEKIRAFHQLRAMGARHEVDLFCFAQQAEEMAHREHLSRYCRTVEVCRLSPRFARLRALPYLLTRTPLTLPHFRSPELNRKIRAAMRARSYDRIFISCSSMAQYVEPGTGIPVLMDFVDVDSDKWAQYARSTAFPFSAIYRRESRYLRDYERSVCERVSRVLVTTRREAELVREISTAVPVEVVPNGVNAAYFTNPSGNAGQAGPAMIFTGDMSYLPNADAVTHFATEVLPLIQREFPGARFLIVGRDPSRSVRELQKIAGVEVTGFVPDVRPFLAQARVAVAPFAIASGIQNKILEAMAFSLPVVATHVAVRGLSEGAARLVETGSSPEELASKVTGFLRDPKLAQCRGREGRELVLADYTWERSLDRVLQLLEAPGGTPPATPSGPVPQPSALMLLTNAYDPDPRVRQEALALLRMGCRMRLLAWDRDVKSPARENTEGVEVERVFLRSAHGRGTMQLFFYASLYLRMFWRGLRTPFDVVHCHDLDTLPLGFALGKLKRKPIVYDAHESFTDMLDGSVHPLVRRALVQLENFLMKRTDLLITVGEKLRLHLVDRGARRSVVVGNWKRADEFSRSEEGSLEVRRGLGIPDDALVVVSITQLLPDRKIKELLDAADNTPDVFILIGGKGVLEPWVRQRASQNDRIRYLGFVPASEIPVYTCAGDVIYYGFDPQNPNARFSAPNKLFEALAAGRPLITGDFGEIADVVREASCGIVLPEYSEEEVRRALCSLQDAVLRQRMARNAKRYGGSLMNWEEGEKVLHREYRTLLPRALPRTPKGAPEPLEAEVSQPAG